MSTRKPRTRKPGAAPSAPRALNDDMPATRHFAEDIPTDRLPETGMSAEDAYNLISLGLKLDGVPSLNLASFVTTWMEPEAEQLIHDMLRTNHIDHEEYPAAQQVEEFCVRMLADLWNAPKRLDPVGVATIGSSEAIMLALLAHKFSWRQRREAAGADASRPNLVYGAETHIVWDKFCRYFDVEPRKVPMSPDRYTIDPKDIVARVDENTIAAGAVIGTTFIGEADPVADIAKALDALQKKTGLDVPIHVDAASGGFILPFSGATEKWDFRLKRVASINASGHKYGLVYPGLGWLVFRDKSYLPEELVFSVNYLGGAQPTYTFNFSRGSAMIQAQYYNFLRLGRRGYTDVVRNMLDNARHLNDLLVADGRFEIMNPRLPEPVVTWRIRDGVDIDPYQLADRLRMHGWIVPAYTLPPDAEDVVVLRAVVRNDMSRPKVEALARHIAEECAYLEKHQAAPDPGRTGAEAQHRRC